MTNKKARAGAEVDAWCTSCKLELNHRIVAMAGEKGDKIEEVECLTCRKKHKFRKPPKAAKVPGEAATGAAPKSAASPRSKRGQSERMTAAAAAERDRVQAWEGAIAGKPAQAFKPYKTTQTFAPGELVRHPKFGDGVVARIIDRGKVEVLFKDGARTMAQGLQA